MNMKQKNKDKKAIILLSGGLDSLVSLSVMLKQGIQIKKALFFDYGQFALEEEKKSVINICNFFNIKYEIIILDWLKKIQTSTIPSLNETDLNKKDLMYNSMKKVWIPNRNGLFINIAGAYADIENSDVDKIIIGANKEEAQTFIDNSINFISAINNSLIYSTNAKPIVIAPLINKTKDEIIELAIECKVPLKFLYSCYKGTKKHCGKCQSCLLLKKALLKFKDKIDKNLINELF